MQAGSDRGCGLASPGLFPANRWSSCHFLSIFFDHLPAGVHRSPADVMPCRARHARTAQGTREPGDRQMTNNALGAAVLTAAALALPGHALARGPAPLVPTALVEEVKSASADVEFMDYVGAGQVIKLEPSDVLVLSYLKSCEHETITGGTVRVGSEKSEVDGGKIVRAKVPCNGRNMKLTPQQANASAASSFRLQNDDAALALA